MQFTIEVTPPRPHPAPNKPERNQILVQLIDQGMSYREVARQFNIGHTHVCNIYKAETGTTIQESNP